MKLQTLIMRNFKGSGTERAINFTDITNIYGANESGKTTIQDAICWLLFGKDSTGTEKFNWKPIVTGLEIEVGDNGKVAGAIQIGMEKHRLQTEVEAVFDNVTLRKMVEENWVKKRGSKDQEFDGHNTSYWVNDVPCKAGEYDSKIKEICPENLFKLLTNPLYFSTQLKWQDARQMLVDLVGDISDDDVLNSSSELKPLLESKGSYSIDDYKKVTQDKLRLVKKDIESLPSRIDEQSRNLPTDEIDYSEAEAKIAELNKEVVRLETAISSGDTSEQRKQLNQSISENDTKIRSLVREIDELTENKKAAHSRKVSEVQNSILLLENSIKQNKAFHETANKLLVEKRIEKEDLLKQSFKAPDSPDVCPTCGQDYPHHLVADLIDKAQAEFTANQKKRLADIQAVGIKQAETVKNIQALIDKDEAALLDKKNELETVLKESVEVDHALIASKNEELSKLKAENNRLGSKLDEFSVNPNSEAIEQKQIIQSQINELNKLIGQKEQHEACRARIKELEESEKSLADTQNYLEGQLFLIEQFVRAKVAMLEQSIDKHFEVARFKLFENQINGGLAECCKVLFKGVPFASANNAGKTQVGLDIIRTFSKKYQFNPPVIIDNREGITEIPNMDCQIINLFVSPMDKKLRIE